MRYLGRFPSEAQIQLIMVQLLEDPNSETLTYDRVEQYLLDVLQSTDFMPATFEALMNCFRRWDPKNTGIIKLDKFELAIRDCKLRYTDAEIKAFVDFLPKDSTGKNFYYEDYVYKLVDSTNKHVKNLYKVAYASKDKDSRAL